MNYEAYIRDYLDGVLSDEAEATFFSALGSDERLRREFQVYRTIQTSQRAAFAAETPPAQLTEQVFRGVGYASPAAVFPPAQSAGSALNSGRTVWGYLSAAFISSLATIVIMSLLADKDTNGVDTAQHSVQQSSQAQESSLAGDHTVVKHSVPDVQNIDETPGVQNSVPVIAGYSDEAPRNTPASDMPTNDEPLKPAYVEIADAAPMSANGIADDFAASSLSNDRFADLVPAPNDDWMTSDVNSPSRWLIGLRSSASLSFPNVDVPTQANTQLGNAALGVWRVLDADQALGIELGRESFGQEFQQIIDERNATVQQNPTLYWGGVSYRRKFTGLRIFGIGRPYAQALIGASEVGPLVRVRSGIEVTPENFVLFTLGIEGAWMAYQVENSWYLSQNFGLTYGVGIRF